MRLPQGLFKTYDLNPETLMYEAQNRPKWRRILDLVAFVVAGLSLMWFYFWLYTSVLGLDLPKTAILKKRNAEWESKMMVLRNALDQYDETVLGIENRDNDVYRAIYGLNEIPYDVRSSGLGGVNRYDYLDEMGANQNLKDIVKRLDVLSKRVCIQSKALDEISELSLEAGDMISCIPAVPPINPKPGSFRLSSTFGGRRDPVHGGWRRHEGIDLATKIGTPTYATGDGVVENVKYQFYGYGNEIIINHGYGYKTRYAHLNAVNVAVGMKVKRGDLVGEVGNTGKSTGPHLHFEVLYKGNPVNPQHYFDLGMSPVEYKAMTDVRKAESNIGKKNSTSEILHRKNK